MKAIAVLLILAIAMICNPQLPAQHQPQPIQQASFYGSYCFEASGVNHCCVTSWWGAVDSCSGMSFSMLYFNHKKPKKEIWLV